MSGQLRGVSRFGAEAVVDGLVVAATYFLATGVRLGGRLDTPEHTLAIQASLIVGAVQVLANALLRVYRRDWSVAALEDLVALSASSAAVAVAIGVANLMLPAHPIPNGAILPGMGLAIVAQAALKLRGRWRAIAETAMGRGAERSQAVIIVGAGSTGQLAARELAGPAPRPRIACFVDDDPQRRGRYIRGIRVEGSVADLPRLVARHRAAVIVVATERADRAAVQRVLEACRGLDVRIRTTQGFGADDLDRARPLGLEEIVLRDPADLAVGSSGVPFARPDITNAEIDAVTEVLRSGWLTTGPITKRFEREVAQRLGVRRAVAVSSGTAALHLALEAIGLRRGDEVIVPTYTFTSTAEVVRYFDASVVLVDVCADDLNIDPAAAQRAITHRTRAIVGVDIAGQPCDWPALRRIADATGVRLVDDAAHALPASLDGRPIGRWADATAFSFYSTKTLATGEGGMLVTDDDAIADRAEVMALHGISRDAWKRYAVAGGWRYEVVAPGFKYNLTDIASALGRVQLARLDEMQARRAAIAARYGEAFRDVPAVETPTVRPGRTVSWHLYIVRLRDGALRIDRSRFIEELADRGIGASVHFIPLHLQPYWRDTYGHAPDDMPVATREFGRAISLPIYSAMTDQAVERVIAAVRAIAEGNAA